MATWTLKGYRVCPTAPIIAHLCFADDTIIICEATPDQAIVVKQILHHYERASGQQVNFAKTDVSFSKGVKADRRNTLTICLDIREVLSHEKYLGDRKSVV